jgi:hypothetical protein
VQLPASVWDILGQPHLVESWNQLSWAQGGYDRADTAELRPGSPVYEYINRVFALTRNTWTPSRIVALRSADATSEFKSRIRKLGQRFAQGLPPLPAAELASAVVADGTSDLRRRLEPRTPQLPPHCNILLAWHGTSSDRVYQVAHTGIRSLRHTDAGFFGVGSYTTLDAWYAANYSTSSEKCVLLVAVVVGNVRVITKQFDYTGKAAMPYCCDHFGKAMMANVDTYYVPVKDGGSPEDYQACSAHEAEARELVSADYSHCWPIAAVFLR